MKCLNELAKRKTTLKLVPTTPNMLNPLLKAVKYHRPRHNVFIKTIGIKVCPKKY